MSSTMKVIDFISLLRKYDCETTVDAVFRDTPNLNILCDIIRTVDPTKLPRRDGRSRTHRALRAVGEVKSAEFGTSLVPLLAEWEKEPAKFFEPWSLQPESEPDPVEPEPGLVEPEPNGVESEPEDVESETESIESEPESAGSGLGNVESESEIVEADPKRFALKAELYKKVAQARKIICRKQADTIRWIFLALFFRDLLIRFTRNKDDRGLLPRGKALRPLVEKACRQLTGEDIVPKTVDEIMEWSKVGQAFHLIGAELGEGSLLLLSDHISQNKWINSLPRKASTLAPVLKPLKLAVSEELKKHHANKVARGIRNFQLEPYQLSSTSSDNYLDLQRPLKRHRKKYNSGPTTRLKRLRIPERTRNQRPFPESHLHPAAELEVPLANQEAQEQASRTGHPDSINMESHSIPGNIHQWTPLRDLEPDFTDFAFANFESDFEKFKADLANFEPDFHNFN